MAEKSKISLRRAQQKQASALTSLMRVSKAYWGYTPQQMAVWKAELSLSEQEVRDKLVVSAEDQSAALLGFYTLLFDGDCARIEHLFVDPAKMGRGVGKALLQHAIASARQQGSRIIDIDADPYAEDFYLKNGAQRVGEIAAPVACQPSRVRPQLRITL
jgi:N-acetylglutamate synthase-like GNAT family acetyltransferase